MSVKLWQKLVTQDRTAEAYLAGDIGLDQRLVSADVVGSVAHARMLQKIGILSADEFAALRAALLDILRLDAAGEFELRPEDEDVHTRVENYLVAALGDTGKKIHTARSRNDQIALDMRLFAKEALLAVEASLLDAVEAFLDLARRHEAVPMVGYTHMQRAMLSSVGLWAASFAESLLDDQVLLAAAYGVIDQSPLGSAASYGVPLPIDREYTAALLGFSRVHGNVLAAQHGRGKYEALVTQALSQVMLDLGRFAQDTLLFTTSEFAFFSLDERLCTGSSIMPQKRNADILELTRGNAAVVAGLANQILVTIVGLPSGYNADVSLTKGPFMRAIDLTQATLDVCALAARGLTPNEAALRAALSPEVYATDAAYDLVERGVPFRDAYRQVAANLGSLAAVDPGPELAARRHTGATGNLGLGASSARLAAARADQAARSTRFQGAIQRLIEGTLS